MGARPAGTEGDEAKWKPLRSLNTKGTEPEVGEQPRGKAAGDGGNSEVTWGPFCQENPSHLYARGFVFFAGSPFRTEGKTFERCFVFALQSIYGISITPPSAAQKTTCIENALECLIFRNAELSYAEDL